MADFLGALALPVPVPNVADPNPALKTRAPGDPALWVLGSFLATVLNALCGEAWAALDPSKQQLGAEADLGATGSVVRRIFFFNPQARPFVLEDLPALFVFRAGDRGNWQRYSADRYRRTDTISAWWAARQVEGKVQIERDAFVSALDAAAATCVFEGFHPSWVLDSDKAKPGTIATSIVGQATAWSASGASLDGVLASTTMPVARPVLIQTPSLSGAFVPGPITVTGLDGAGRVWKDTVDVTDPDGGESLLTLWRFAKVTQVDFGAHTTSARFVVGYGDSPEVRQGSRMKRAAGFQQCLQRRPGETKTLSMPAGEGRTVMLPYLDMQFEVTEEFEPDPLGRGRSLLGGADGIYQIPPQSQGDMPSLPFAQNFATSSF